MKLEQTGPGFEPYKIVVETKEEHNFLSGLFDANSTTRKDCCNGFSTTLDIDFSDLIEGVQ